MQLLSFHIFLHTLRQLTTSSFFFVFLPQHSSTLTASLFSTSPFFFHSILPHSQLLLSPLHRSTSCLLCFYTPTSCLLCASGNKGRVQPKDLCPTQCVHISVACRCQRRKRGEAAPHHHVIAS